MSKEKNSTKELFKPIYSTEKAKNSMKTGIFYTTENTKQDYFMGFVARSTRMEA